MWLAVCFDTDSNFPKASHIITYDNYQIEIKRGAPQEQHNIFIRVANQKYKLAFDAALCFLSELTWLFNVKIKISIHCISGIKLGLGDATERIRFNRIGHIPHLDIYKQLVSEEKRKLALGLYREGVSSNSDFYSYLSFFKIINIGYHKGPDQISWINRNIQHVSDRRGVRHSLANQGVKDVGEHLYKSGRCALAHASLGSGHDIASPNNFDDNTRIGMELPLIKELAKFYMTNELKIPTLREALKQWYAVKS